MIFLVFRIELDTNLFTVPLPSNKLNKQCGLASTEWSKKNMTLLEPQTLTKFLSFYAKVVRLGSVFIGLFLDFVVQFFSCRLGFCQRILWQFCDDSFLLNDLLLKFNSVIFFDEKRWKTYWFYKDQCLVGLRVFTTNTWQLFGKMSWLSKTRHFLPWQRNCKDSYLLPKSGKSMIHIFFQASNIPIRISVNINFFKLHGIILRFQPHIVKEVNSDDGQD